VADLHEIVEFLDAFLGTETVADAPGARNGLQVDARSPVELVCAAVDACQATIDEAAARGAQLLLVHHGLFWGDPLPITGRTYRRLKALFDADLALYSSHAPLDVHPEIGNNVLLAEALGLEIEGRFGSWRELEDLGVWSTADLSLDGFVRRVGDACGADPFVIPGGPSHVRRIGIITGGADSAISQAHEAGLDTFVTGEGSHHAFHDAVELGLNVIFAGHYLTEVPGVKALASTVAEQFGIGWSFVDHPTGL
jgi:dinuclear metal center YbgI/SA1388 family protein